MVYQVNGHALACSAVRVAYPVMVKLLGDECFDALAWALWHASPPRRGDVAALEWVLHTGARAAKGGSVGFAVGCASCCGL